MTYCDEHEGGLVMTLDRDDYHWLLCPECECGITKVDVDLGSCTNCGFEFESGGE